jgi:2-oxoglutarate ferredoxin oxidoreductase subunit gamma
MPSRRKQVVERVIIAGFGGQGVLFSGKLLAHAGMIAGFTVSQIPAYGAEMRGGTANCSVVISDAEIGSPIVDEPTTIICLNIPSVERFLPMLVPRGLLVVNASLVKNTIPRDDISIVYVNANDLAREAGNPAIVNMPAIGAYAKARGVVPFDVLCTALEAVISAKYRELLAVNRKALTLGYTR